ncbi:MAG: AAA family ATPase [Aestuariivita sp.]|nr:AAA family ATPase [Aestuariivita sp.]
MSSLKASFDLTPLQNIDLLTEEQEQRLNTLQKDLSQDPVKASDEQNRRATKIEQLKTQLNRIADACSDDSLLGVVEKQVTAKTKRRAATVAAQTAFGDLDMKGVGTSVWQTLWASAKSYATSLGEDLSPFPPAEGQACVLCHQEIKSDAATRMRGFEEFIQKDTERLAARAEQEAQEAVVEFKNFRIEPQILATIRDVVVTTDSALAKNIRRFLASARVRLSETRKFLGTLPDHPSLTALEPLRGDAIDELAGSVRTYAASLSASIDHEGRQRLEDERAELLDIKDAERFHTIAVAEVERLKSLALVDACLKDMATTTITKLGNAIADDLITPLMQDRFQKEIVALADNRVRVKIERSGGKFGSPQYLVRLFASSDAKVENVLSEGEQTCVALASYLTELANASHSSALVFDDPVTSLDHIWRNSVAERLAEEAKVRQVVVFTHDLIFVNDLHQLAKKAGTPVKLAHLGRGVNGVGLVSDNLPWEAASIRHRIDDLEKHARAANRLYDAQDDARYRASSYDFYDKLRSTWERGVEDILFSGVVVRHRDYVNLKGLDRVAALTPKDIQAVVSGFGKCSNHIKGHDPSRGRNAAAPKPTDMIADIQALKTWEEDLRKRQNAASQQARSNNKVATA